MSLAYPRDMFFSIPDVIVLIFAVVFAALMVTVAVVLRQTARAEAPRPIGNHPARSSDEAAGRA
jgi:hypothetical protein